MALSRLSQEFLFMQVRFTVLIQHIFQCSITWPHHSHIYTNNIIRNSHTVNKEYIIALLIPFQMHYHTIV